MNILIFGSCVTDTCLNRRKNREYLAETSRKKLLAVAENLEKLGHRADICSVSYARCTDSAFTEQISANIRIIHAPVIGVRGKFSFFKRTIGTLSNLFYAIRKHRNYDLFMFYNYHLEYSLPALLTARLFSIRTVLEYEDGLFLNRGYQGLVYRFWERLVYRWTDGFLLVNGGLKDRIRRFVSSDKPMQVVHGLIDEKTLERHQADRQGPVRRTAFTGRFSRGVGFEELMDYTRYADPSLKFDITGRAASEEQEALKQQIDRRPGIRFHGFLETGAFQAMIRGTDAFIVLNDTASPYNQTNFPSKLIEYLSGNRFVITTANPLLALFLKMKNVIVLDDIRNFMKIREITRNRTTDSREIEALARNFRSELGDFLQKMEKI